jgi:putative ABC transport system permease protein
MSFNIEILGEIFYSIKHNRMRTILSGFGISWGILILVVLLGTGKGFQNAVMNLFSAFAQKSIYVYGGVTSLKHNNIKEGQEIRFDESYLKSLQNKYPEIEAISPETSISLLVQKDMKSAVFKITGINADYMQIKILRVKEDGRLFNQADIDQERNVAIIGENVETTLFGNKEAQGKQINISGIFFKVTGVLKNDNIFSAAEINSVYIPYSSYVRTIDSDPGLILFVCISPQKQMSLSMLSDTKTEDKMKTLKVCIIIILLSITGFIVYRSFNKENKINYTTISLEKRDINETIYIP